MSSIIFFIIGLAIGVGATYFLLTAKSKITIEAIQQNLTEAKATIEAERNHTAQMVQANAEALRQEFKVMARDMANTEGQELRKTHLEQLSSLLSPLEKNMSEFRQQITVQDASMKQQMKDLFDHTSDLGRRADSLAKALTADSKKQGNWGEAILKNILEASGLTEGRDFEVQARTTTSDGRTQIPDVVVHLPDHRNVIVDSKVSLTAFTRYVSATDKAEQETYLKEHLRSVRQHITELSGKNYHNVVEGSIGYVLLFIPNEPAYLAAVDADEKLTSEAYAQQVILINPSNLFMALQLAYNLWQTQLREKSVQDIYISAEKLYTKFVGFSRNFVKVDESLNKAKEAYDDARKQLCEGKGNIVRQLEKWRKLGLNPKDSLPPQLNAKDDADES